VSVSLDDRERRVVADFRHGRPVVPLALSNDGDEPWLTFAIAAALRAAATVRGGELGLGGGDVDVDVKIDGSPVTRIEHEVEVGIGNALAEFAPEAVLVGEETGGTLPDRGDALAVDPVDGTWAYVGGTGTYSTTLAVVRDGAASVGVVAAPAAGRVVYATPTRARLLQLSTFGEPDGACDLPLQERCDPILVNLHPGRTTGDASAALQNAWSADEIRMLRSPGGSPSLALAEAAAGRFVYVNLWSKRPAAPFDLVAGALIVRAAGGEVVDLDGRPVDAMTHLGPFVAAIDPVARDRIAALVARAVHND
jgi:fructose-1,6-bisphosphatase/inositol monophosphatase family enzyme